MDDWIEVSGYKDVPIGNWIVQVDKSSSDCDMHVMNVHKNISTVGQHFTFDMPRVLRYHPLPKVSEH